MRERGEPKSDDWSDVRRRVHRAELGELLAPDQPDVEAVIRERLNGYTPPALPPADMPVDPDKWRHLDRRTRRVLLRHHRKVTG